MKGFLLEILQKEGFERLLTFWKGLTEYEIWTDRKGIFVIMQYDSIGRFLGAMFVYLVVSEESGEDIFFDEVKGLIEACLN